MDFVRRWSEKTGISAMRFIEWLDITADIQVANIDVPVLMCCQRLHEARALLGRLAIPFRQKSRLG
jgi:hypothetical protein